MNEADSPGRLPVALITGASRGIGAARAEELAARGYRLALLSRSDTVFEVGRRRDALALQRSVTSFRI